MKRTQFFFLALLATMGLRVWSAEDLSAVSFQDLLGGLTWSEAATGQSVCRELLRRGPAGLDAVCAAVKSPAEANDATARFAVHGLALLTASSADGQERLLVESAILRALAQAADPDVRTFFMEQLHLVGGTVSVEALVPFLADERLCEPATQTLLALRPPGAAAIFQQAVASASGGRLLTLVRALGVLGDTGSAPMLLPLLKTDDTVLRGAVLYALANSGSAEVREPLSAALTGGNRAEAARAIQLSLLLAQRLGEGGDIAQASELCHLLLKRSESQAVCGALALLVDLGAADVFDRLAESVRQGDAIVRATALRLGQHLPGEAVTAGWIAQAGEVRPEIRAAIVAMLGPRRDNVAVPFLVSVLEDADAGVRGAAAEALGCFGTDQALVPLLKHLEHAEDGDVAVVCGVLGRLPGEAVITKTAAALTTVTPAARAALIGLLAQRGAKGQVDAVFATLADEDRNVRKAALNALEVVASPADIPRLTEFMLTASGADQKAAQVVLGLLARSQPAGGTYILEKLAAASEKERVPLLQTLPRIGGTAALAAVVADLKQPEPAVREAAVRALADWPEPAAATPLFALVSTPENEIFRVLALRGYIRLAGVRAADNPAEAVEMLRQAMAACRNPGERKQVLGQLGSVHHAEALKLAVTALADTALQDEAAAAIVKIACPKDKADPGMHSPEAFQALSAVVRSSGNAGLVAEANKQLETFPIGGGRNIALGKPVTTSCPQQGDKAPWKAVDGKLGKLDAWFGNTWPSWFQADLKKVVALDGVRIVFYWDGKRSYQYNVEVSADAATWTKVVDNAGNTEAETESGHAHRFLSPVSARYVRLNILKNSVNEAVHLVELQVYSNDPNAETLAVGAISNPDNLALGRAVTISCRQQENYAPAAAVDGLLDRGHAYWGDASPSWLQVDLGEPQSIDSVRIIFHWDGKRCYTYDVQTSEDGENWVKIVDNSGNTTPADAMGLVHTFKPVTARFVRLDILRNSANPYVHVVEFEVYAAGKAPKVFPTSEPPAVSLPPLPPPDSEGFISLFNGRDLTGWIGSVNGYTVEDGCLVCKADGGGKLLTAHQFSDFILHFDFRMPKGANNGLAIRSPENGNPAYEGMELQIIDNDGYAEVHNYTLKPWQVHGSIYGVVPAKTGALKPCGEWNHQEVRAEGDRIMVILNGRTIVDADLSEISETADGKGRAGHPGLARGRGHIGWLGHGARVEFRNIRLKPEEPYSRGPFNVPPEGFTALFNGRDLSGWKGLVANPEKRAAMNAETLAAAQTEADKSMCLHWQAVDETLVFDGKGQSLCTERQYGNFELWVDWKIKENGDSGIYLRGSPQVQIWDTAKHPEGSGGLYNNQKNPSKPLMCMDNPVGQWNRFRIRMVGERVWVWLNDGLVVDNVIMENYWNRGKPIYPCEQIELQNHGNTLYFRNIFIRELPAENAASEP